MLGQPGGEVSFIQSPSSDLEPSRPKHQSYCSDSKCIVFKLFKSQPKMASVSECHVHGRCRPKYIYLKGDAINMTYEHDSHHDG